MSKETDNDSETALPNVKENIERSLFSWVNTWKGYDFHFLGNSLGHNRSSDSQNCYKAHF